MSEDKGVTVTIEIPHGVFEDIAEWLGSYEDVTVTAEELKANPTAVAWLTEEIPNYYNICGSEGYENMSLAEACGLEPNEDEDDED